MQHPRNRAWRRFKNTVNQHKGMGTGELFKPEKNWKQVYLRSEKLNRAKQLGFEYPRKNVTKQALEEQYCKTENTHLLFICSRNQWRSPTAQNLWRRSSCYDALSAGTSPKAKKTVSTTGIQSE